MISTSRQGGSIGKLLDDRDDTLSKLFEKGLGTGVQDLDLDATVEELRAAVGGEGAGPKE